MKIGIITILSELGYGSMLQAYALQQVLRDLGHNVTTIKFSLKPNKLNPILKPFVILKRLFIKLMIDRTYIINQEHHLIEIDKILKNNTSRFVDKHITYRVINDFKDLNENEYDAIVVGSDQVWRVKYFKNIESYFLDFAKKWNILRIAYAASFGIPEWDYTEEQTKRCSELIKKFKSVSVRELDAVNLCKLYLGAEVQHVLDPTLLLSKDDYIKLIPNFNTQKHKPFIFAYLLDENEDKLKSIDLFHKIYDKLSVKINSTSSNKPLQERVLPPVEEWLESINNCDTVFTDSFHGCVFSIIFNKPFIVYANKERGLSRFNSILSILNLTDRLVYNSEEVESVINKPILWDEVNAKLSTYKLSSKNFLENALI